MPAYNTPGVYVEEISTLPPSVADVSTAIPAFFGCTEKGSAIARVTTLLEYEDLFGGPNPEAFTVAVAAGELTGVTTQVGAPEFLLYYAVSHYFKNGGGACYIVPVGDYSAAPVAQDFSDGLALLEKEDEPTLIVLTDAVNLPAANYYSLCQDALAQCHKLADRFAIFDVPGGDVDAFRNGIGTNYLAFGAAYHPYLQTSLSYDYDESTVTISPAQSPWSKDVAANTIRATFIGADGAAPTVAVSASAGTSTTTFAVTGRALTITCSDTATGSSVVSAWNTWKATNDAGGFDVVVAGTGAVAVPNTAATNLVGLNTLGALKSTNTALYNKIKTSLASQLVVLPPSAAVAGIYASVDRDRGVWKAPANVSVASVIGPMSKITDDEQEALNVDPTAGKSINAIRAFTGKGTLVWGARTLAGNDNEWRYVPVRRLFLMIEESSRLATSFAVFEPNDVTTWLKVKGMIDSFLHGLWERGALAGSTPAAAYYVNVGLGKTMTAQDILEGRMIVEIGIAAVRPAEFVILRFSHMLQQA